MDDDNCQQRACANIDITQNKTYHKGIYKLLRYREMGKCKEESRDNHSPELAKPLTTRAENLTSEENLLQDGSTESGCCQCPATATNSTFECIKALLRHSSQQWLNNHTCNQHQKQTPQHQRGIYLAYTQLHTATQAERTTTNSNKDNHRQHLHQVGDKSILCGDTIGQISTQQNHQQKTADNHRKCKDAECNKEVIPARKFLLLGSAYRLLRGVNVFV